MAEIFKEPQGFDNHPDRWNHDLSHKHYGSYKAGILYPVLTHLMAPGDTIKLDTAALLQFMPTPTPLQSNVRVIFHTFFQRMKNISEDWPNVIEGLEDHDLPYIRPSVTEFTPGSIHDFLDVPCCVVVNGQKSLSLRYFVGVSADSPFCVYNSSGHFIAFDPDGTEFVSAPSLGYGLAVFLRPFSVPPSSDPSAVFDDSIKFSLPRYPFKTDSSSSLLPNFKVRIGVKLTSDLNPGSDDYSVIDAGAFSLVDAEPYEVLVPSSSFLSFLETLGYDGSQYIHTCLIFCWEAGSDSVTLFSDGDVYAEGRNVYSVLTGSAVFFVYGSYSYAQFPDLCPYSTKEFPDRPIRLKAYRYRVYESNYNSFYRNIHGNQPFKIDGVTQYNKYNTTRASGLDETKYELFCRNWELDAYTSCLPSPQQGNVPYVGISATGRVVVQDDDGTRSTMQLRDLDNGLQGFEVAQFNASTDEHRQIMMRLADSGFTINDLRETNALQKFLETNIRKGFRYIDFIKGHFGVAPKHAEMDMPEFIGGFTVKLDVGKVTNTNAGATAANPEDVLGQFAGTAQAFGSSKHSTQYFADDYGYVQVIMCIVPDAAYSQVLPKDFLYNNPLDFPFPEFSNLGYQPITYEEFCPGEAYKDYMEDPSKPITDVFGYQRPQHERVWLPDRLHGQFLTTMNNYVVNRVFEHRPELGDQFLKIRPEEMTRNFTVTKADEDIAFGQVGFHITYKQPVPRIAIPSIGR